MAQKVTSTPPASSQPLGGSSSGAPTSPPPPPPAGHAGSTSQPDSSSGSLADTIVRHVETAVSGAIPHNVRPDSPVPSRVKAIVADPDPLAHQGTPVAVVAPTRGGGHHAPAGSRRSGPHSSSDHASASLPPAGTPLAGPAASGARLTAALEASQSASLSATGARPGAVAPLAADTAGPPDGADHAAGIREHPRAVPRAGRVDIAGLVDSAAPATAAVAPAGSEGSGSGVGAGTSAAAAAILGLAGLWLLRALLPGLLTLDIFPWQSTLRAMRLERPG